MKTYYVYEIYNTLGTVEYVGETTQPKNRFYAHTKKKPFSGTGRGKFYGRQDVTMNIVAEFTDRKEARSLEGQLKLEHGLEWTEKTIGTRNGKQARKLNMDQAQEIRSLYATGNITHMQLAKLYNTTQTLICRILNNKTYIE